MERKNEMKEKKIGLNELAYGDVCKRSRSAALFSSDVQEFEKELLEMIDREVTCEISNVEFEVEEKCG